MIPKKQVRQKSRSKVIEKIKQLDHQANSLSALRNKVALGQLDRESREAQSAFRMITMPEVQQTSDKSAVLSRLRNLHKQKITTRLQEIQLKRKKGSDIIEGSPSGRARVTLQEIKQHARDYYTRRQLLKAQSESKRKGSQQSQGRKSFQKSQFLKKILLDEVKRKQQEEARHRSRLQRIRKKEEYSVKIKKRNFELKKSFSNSQQSALLNLSDDHIQKSDRNITNAPRKFNLVDRRKNNDLLALESSLVDNPLNRFKPVKHRTVPLKRREKGSSQLKQQELSTAEKQRRLQRQIERIKLRLEQLQQIK